MNVANTLDPAAPIGLTTSICGDGTEGLDSDVLGMAQALIGSRQNVSPKRLIEPGPSPNQLGALLSLAETAPDHGLLTPWRFIIVRAEQRHRLAEVFALALIDRDPRATLERGCAREGP